MALAAPFIFFIVLVLDFLSFLLNHLKQTGKESLKKAELQQEIKRLLKEANALSMPSTFAQAAKLQRAAAAKEKELLQLSADESVGNEKKWSPDTCLGYLKILKVLVYFGLICYFWNTPVATVPSRLLQPFGRISLLKKGDSSDGFIRVGVVSWLVLINGVSQFTCKKLSAFLPALLPKQKAR